MAQHDQQPDGAYRAPSDGVASLPHVTASSWSWTVTEFSLSQRLDLFTVLCRGASSPVSTSQASPSASDLAKVITTRRLAMQDHH
ncbi:hypothetical protein L13192_05529 [Pyrenophora tritici-repentis]|uniref:Uncharacterized protein n=1 Tax=Pyrenophora tritici-repentis TaxID=45151 RepID=A0A922T1F1_9PLEO|nr:hypothetical protein Ptr86124_004387 [Pyrenophora tritici-repentis]KAI1670013.1 hypothetical protein L13192_05529 [Pyrenophora tritici-repentis]KAI1681611.1 hypothetical protein KJE20_08482 [Pyrenophora tritici-repentis]